MGARSIAGDQSDAVASLRYYLRADPWTVFSEPDGGEITDRFSLDRPLPTAAGQPILYVSFGCVPEPLDQYYSNIEILTPIDVPTGPHSSRHYCVFKFSSVRTATAPVTAAPH